MLVYKKLNFKFNRLAMSDEMISRYKYQDSKGFYRNGNCIDPRRGRHSFEVQNPNGKIIFSDKWIMTKEKFLELDKNNLIHWGSNQPSTKIYLENSIKNGVCTNDIWIDVSSNQQSANEIKALFLNDENADLFATPKPEALLKRIIEISTNENDLIMDFFAGSGTTLAVAHKMKRQYIGIEQIERHFDICTNRLKKVIEGEQGGISKMVDWKNGGEFVYFELAKYNETAKEKIINGKDYEDIKKDFDEICDKFFLRYNLNIKEFEKIINSEEFKNLNLEKQKEIFISLLDPNQMYINYSNMEDKKYKLNKKDIERTREFYKNG